MSEAPASEIDARAFRLGPDGHDAPAVLCLHGLTGTPYEVRPPAEALAAAGFTCVGPVLPGHDSTPRDLARRRRGEWLDFVQIAWDALAERHPRVYVLGLSMGAVLTLALAERRPLPGAVVIAAPLELPAAARATVPWIWPLVPGPGLSKTPGILDDAARAAHPGYRHMPLAAVAQLIRLGREVRADLESVVTPLQLIYSTRDGTVPYHNAEIICSGVASEICQLTTLHDSGHVIPVDRERRRVAALVVDFLRSCEARAPEARS